MKDIEEYLLRKYGKPGKRQRSSKKVDMTPKAVQENKRPRRVPVELANPRQGLCQPMPLEDMNGLE